MSAFRSAPARARPAPIAAPVGIFAFLKALFAYTDTAIYICSFPNERGDRRKSGAARAAQAR